MTSTPTPPTSTRDVVVDHSSVLSRIDLRGRAIGTINLALFALVWTNWGLTGIVDTVAVSTIAAAVLCSVACVAGAILVFRRAAAAPDSMDVARGRAVGRRFGAVVAAHIREHTGSCLMPQGSRGTSLPDALGQRRREDTFTHVVVVVHLRGHL